MYNQKIIHFSTFVLSLIFSLCFLSCEKPNDVASAFSLSEVSFDTKVVTADNFGTPTTGVSTQPSIMLMFSSTLGSGTLNGNIKLTNLRTGAIIPIQFKYLSQTDKSTTILLASSTASLSRGEQYKITVTTGVKSASNVALDKEYTILFNTLSKNTEANLTIEFNRTTLVAVNDLYAVYVATVTELSNITLKFTVSPMATLIRGTDTIRTTSDIATRSFAYTNGQIDTFTVVSEDGLKTVKYKVRFRAGQRLKNADLVSCRIRVGGKDFDGTISGQNVSFTLRDLPFGTNLNGTISYIQISQYASANKILGSTLNFSNSSTLQDSIKVTAEDPTVTKTYTLSITPIPQAFKYMTYTSTDTLGTVGINSTLANTIGDFISISDLADATEFYWYVNGKKSTTSRASVGSVLYLKHSDLGIDFGALRNRDTIRLALEGNNQKSINYNIFFVRQNIFTWQDFQSITTPYTLPYTVIRDISFPADRPFVPIGGVDNLAFSGTIDGRGFELRNVNLNLPNNSFVGLFSEISTDGVVKSLRVKGAVVSGMEKVGAIAGRNYGIISNCLVTGTRMNGANAVGGITGWNASSGVVSGAFQGNIAITGNSVGGLVGENYGNVVGWVYNVNGDTITGNNHIGGLVGRNYKNVLGYAYITLGGNNAGGLIGTNTASSFGTGQVIGFASPQFLSSSSNVGGLVGLNGGPIIGYWNASLVSDAQGVAENSSANITNTYPISSINNVQYKSGGLYDEKGTTSTVDDVEVFNNGTFRTYFSATRDPLTSQPYSKTWPQLVTGISFNSQNYTLEIAQPRVP